MNSNEPKVTVLMPAYNAGEFIAEAIASVLAQTFTGFELLIVNDGSTDNTLEVINSFKDPRIVVISQPNQGVATALNTGLRHAKAPYIARFDADDICFPDRLQLQYDTMTENPDHIIIGSNADYVDVEGNYLFTHRSAAATNDELQALNYRVCPFIHSTVFYVKDVIVKAGGYNVHAYTFEDHFLWRNIIKLGKAGNISRSLIKVRLNPGSITIDEKWRPLKFRRLKYSTLKKGSITEADGKALHKIGEQQYTGKIKQGAYYALCGKKYLLNNYKPQKARLHISKAIDLHPFRLENYLLYAASFLSERLITTLHNMSPSEWQMKGRTA